MKCFEMENEVLVILILFTYLKKIFLIIKIFFFADFLCFIENEKISKNGL